MNKIKSILVNLSRTLLALTFIFSGFVKAIDPLGSQYKIAEYLEAVQLSAYIPDWAQLILSVGLSAIEFTLGVTCYSSPTRQQAISYHDGGDDACDPLAYCKQSDTGLWLLW